MGCICMSVKKTPPPTKNAHPMLLVPNGKRTRNATVCRIDLLWKNGFQTHSMKVEESMDDEEAEVILLVFASTANFRPRCGERLTVPNEHMQGCEVSGNGSILLLGRDTHDIAGCRVNHSGISAATRPRSLSPRYQRGVDLVDEGLSGPKRPSDS